MTEVPRTEAGRRLLWMFELTEYANGRYWPRAFDALLARRIVEEFIPRIEKEAWTDGPMTDHELGLGHRDYLGAATSAAQNESEGSE